MFIFLNKYIYICLNIVIILFFALVLMIEISFIKIIIPILPIILSIALITLFERKILAAFQRRRGPNVVGIFGLLQPFADAFKLIFKETIIPGLSNISLFLIAPVFIFSMALLS